MNSTQLAFDGARKSLLKPMTAISLWQPWATLWALGEKQFETRHWSFPRYHLNQTIYIHAAQKWNGELADYCRMKYFSDAFLRHLDVLGEDTEDQIGVSYRLVNIGDNRHIKLPFGALVGSVKLIGDKSTSDATWMAPDERRSQEIAFGDYSQGRRAWIGSEHRLFKSPVALKGAQGFFTAPEVEG